MVDQQFPYRGIGARSDDRAGHPSRAEFLDPLKPSARLEVGGLDAGVNHSAHCGGNSATSRAPKILPSGATGSASTAARTPARSEKAA